MPDSISSEDVGHLVDPERVEAFNVLGPLPRRALPELATRPNPIQGGRHRRRSNASRKQP